MDGIGIIIAEYLEHGHLGHGAVCLLYWGSSPVNFSLTQRALIIYCAFIRGSGEIGGSCP